MLSQKSAVWKHSTVSSASAAHKHSLDRVTRTGAVGQDTVADVQPEVGCVEAQHRIIRICSITTVLPCDHVYAHQLGRQEAVVSLHHQKNQETGRANTFIFCRVIGIMICIMCVPMCMSMPMSVPMCAPAPDSAGLGRWRWRGSHVAQIHLLKHLYT